jgi:hypothetical protein
MPFALIVNKISITLVEENLKADAIDFKIPSARMRHCLLAAGNDVTKQCV